MKHLFFFLLLAGMTTIISCKGEQGTPGPAGVMGQDGEDGLNGQDGNANIKSYTTSFESSDWVVENSNRFHVDIPVPIITEEIYNSGLVMMYMQNPGGQYWDVLPLSVGDGVHGVYAFFYKVMPGHITLYSTSTVSFPFMAGQTVRIVVATSEGLVRQQDLDWANYTEVQQALDLSN